jgi:hypothetical protein
VVVVLLNEGLQLPMMPLFDVDGNIIDPPEHIVGKGVNIGVIGLPVTSHEHVVVLNVADS